MYFRMIRPYVFGKIGERHIHELQYISAWNSFELISAQLNLGKLFIQQQGFHKITDGFVAYNLARLALFRYHNCLLVCSVLLQIY